MCHLWLLSGLKVWHAGSRQGIIHMRWLWLAVSSWKSFHTRWHLASFLWWRYSVSYILLSGLQSGMDASWGQSSSGRYRKSGPPIHLCISLFVFALQELLQRSPNPVAIYGQSDFQLVEFTRHASLRDQYRLKDKLSHFLDGECLYEMGLVQRTDTNLVDLC